MIVSLLTYVWTVWCLYFISNVSNGAFEHSEHLNGESTSQEVCMQFSFGLVCRRLKSYTMNIEHISGNTAWTLACSISFLSCPVEILESTFSHRKRKISSSSSLQYFVRNSLHFFEVLYDNLCNILVKWRWNIFQRLHIGSCRVLFLSIDSLTKRLWIFTWHWVQTYPKEKYEYSVIHRSTRMSGKRS